ncbi:DUF1752-domain-containing protein [Myriangium duriaei CBS 260.36]|uniref:DUF1752-domain-containing protein n=1 Tax=Myriangium duriaei CBS 260.36 TaxID=1168546 RepID=A0A9P4J3T2_9PEZI|nr:DUF1752-domain-containing protein [Myriangium duriaei CBS 260.36]
MPFRPQESLLNLNLERMHTIDTRSVEDLFGLWTVFSKTSNALEDGKRLENMSWRLWNRETFCCSPQAKSRSNLPYSARESPPRKKSSAFQRRVPELASSVDTIDTDEDDFLSDATTDSSPTNVVRPELTRLESNETRTQKHISPVDLEKIVVSIKQTREIEPIDDLALPVLSTSLNNTTRRASESSACKKTPSRPATTTEATSEPEVTPIPHHNLPLRTRKLESSTSTVTTSSTTDASPDDSNGSDSSSTAMSTHNIVRGFVPGGAPSSYRSQTNLAAMPTPILKNSPRNMPTQARKKGAMFTLGTSSGEDESSLESHIYKGSISSLSEGLHKKQASFRDNNLVSKIQDSPVFESDDEDEDDEDDVSEGVIDDDEDSSDWEDELGDEDASDAEDDAVFHKVDSRPNLTSRRSLLTSLMHEGDRARALHNAASKSTPAIRRTQTSPLEGSSRAASPAARERNGPDVQGSAARPIAMNAAKQYPHLALSPRTTRRNMLSSELTESLRKNLLWERQHKSSQNVAALKRRHTSHDIKNLKQHPDPQPHISNNENAAKFNNDYFHAGLGEYHSKGW